MRGRQHVPGGWCRRAERRTGRFSSCAAALLGGLLALLLAGPLAPPAGAIPAWPTYHHDAGRSGVDPDGSEPHAPTFDWQSADLGAPIWGQPLLLGGRGYVANVGDRLAALDVSSGSVLWSQILGTPVPAGKLPCGDIFPTVGIVGTPVIDPAAGVIYAVADTWDAATEKAQHVLVGVALADGREVLRTPVDPPGADPKALLQRTALNLDQGRVIFGMGGNDGDCGEYRGAVVAVPQDGAAASFWQTPIALPSKSGGAVWATSGPAVDGEGHIFASTGNPNPPAGQTASTYDYSDSVVELSPALALEGAFAPSNWEAESNTDLDLASAGAELLPGGLLFQAGKDGIGHLIQVSSMGAQAPAVYSHTVCAGRGSFGGDAYAAGVIYIACTNGVQALAYDQAARSFTPLWQGPGAAFGPPILSAGLVWSAATGGFSGGGTKLYGLDPATGAVRYTEILPRPIADHFGSPSAGGGRLFMASGTSVTAYRVAQLTAFTETSTPGGSGPGVPLPPTGGVFPRPALIAAPAPVLLHRSLHAESGGRVRLTLRCKPRGARCRAGTLTLRARITVRSGSAGHRRRRIATITLVRGRYGAARGDFVVTLRLGPGARAHLRLHRAGLALRVVIGRAGGASRVFRATLS
jgi:hypothetical protein